MKAWRFGQPAMAGAFIATGAFGSAMAQQQLFDGYYRGSWECEQSGIGMLRTELRLRVRNGKIGMSMEYRFDIDGQAKFAPPGTGGIVAPDGAFRLDTGMYSRDETFHNTYTGKFSATGGTMTGTEVWTRVPAGRKSVSRTCNGTFAKVEPPLKLFDGIYKGSSECEQSGIGTLRSSLLVLVGDDGVFVSASLFDIDGREMSQREGARDVKGALRLAREGARGIVAPDGAFHLADTVNAGDATFHSAYTGRFSATSGTMTGTQAWTRVGGSSVSRTCNGTFVKVEPQ